MTETEIARLTDQQFEGSRLALKGRWVVLFQGPWCPFCQRFRGLFGQAHLPEGVRLAEYVMDDFYEPVPLAFDIEVIPTVIAFEDGVISWRHSGIPNRGLGEATMHKIEKWS